MINADHYHNIVYFALLYNDARVALFGFDANPNDVMTSRFNHFTILYHTNTRYKREGNNYFVSWSIALGCIMVKRK